MFDELNKKKQHHEMHMTIGYVVTGISFVLFLPLGAVLGPGVIIIMIFFAGGGIYANHHRKLVKEMSNDFKRVHVTRELEKVFPNSKYYYDKGFTEQEVIASQLLRHQDRFQSEDMIIGKFDNVDFKCSDVHQIDIVKTKNGTRRRTVFQGRFYEFDFFKNFKYNLILAQPYTFRPFSTYHKVKMESIHFNSEMKVYAEDEHEAFYILTPHFMEKLLVLDRKYRDKISFSFLNNKLYIAIDSRKDYFDVLPFKPLDESLIREYLDEFYDIKEFITLLTLNSRLFK